jgi:CDP-glucose 4,6-dehydratase
MHKPDANFWKNKRVLITGHTGFIGGWMSRVLIRLGAKVSGYALAPNTEPNLFETLKFSGSNIGDIEDDKKLSALLKTLAPEIVIHLAAQPIVSAAFYDPVESFRVNVMGTARLLHLLREVPSVQSILTFTTDKVYDNQEQGRAFTETDPLGGKGIYDASKAAQDILLQSFYYSYFEKLGMAWIRAGNVIGGGDWGASRIVPDAVRAFSKNVALTLRAPQAIRPWQHVLEPVMFTLGLAEKLGRDPKTYSGPWNVGPNSESEVTVHVLAEVMRRMWSDKARVEIDKAAASVPESQVLRLTIEKAKNQLNWNPKWDFDATIVRTVFWYQAYYRGDNMLQVTDAQIDDYMS